MGRQYGGRITGEVVGINLLVVEMPRANIEALAAEDAVQWIEPAAPPLTEANDGSRQQIGVDVVQAGPYSLDGTNIDVLVYDGGRVGAHVDFGTRLITGDATTVSEHATHVAGTVGGSGANSTAHGGTALQWRGMAPNVDLISYGTDYSGSDIIFRIAVKPTSSIEKTQETITIEGVETAISTKGRHDPCICPRIVPVVEAMAALVLIDHLKRQAGEKA